MFNPGLRLGESPCRKQLIRASPCRRSTFISTVKKHGGELPSVDDVRRRLGLGRELDSRETFGEAWSSWLGGKRKARPSYADSLTQIGRNWLLRVLADVPLDRLTGEQCAMVFERIEMFNDETDAARADGREPALPGDARLKARRTGIATQHRIYAALRVFLNRTGRHLPRSRRQRSAVYLVAASVAAAIPPR